MTARAQVALLHPLTDLREIFAELVRFPEVNEYFTTMVGGTDTRYRLGEDGDAAHPLTGRRVPGVAAAARAVPELAAAWTAGRGVLLDLSEDPVGRLDLTGWTGRVALVRTKPLPGVDAEALLLRPDGRVCWAARNAEGAGGLADALTAWFGDPAPTD